MKSDINIPEVENVFLAAISQYSDDFGENVWNVYLINDSDFDIENVMVVSSASGTVAGEMKKTSLLRHAFEKVVAISFVKVEMIEKQVLQLNNEFMVTYFLNNRLYDKRFIFKKHFDTQSDREEVPLLFVEGIIIR